VGDTVAGGRRCGSTTGLVPRFCIQGAYLCNGNPIRSPRSIEGGAIQIDASWSSQAVIVHWHPRWGCSGVALLRGFPGCRAGRDLQGPAWWWDVDEACLCRSEWILHLHSETVADLHLSRDDGIVQGCRIAPWPWWARAAKGRRYGLFRFQLALLAIVAGRSGLARPAPDFCMFIGLWQFHPVGAVWERSCRVIAPTALLVLGLAGIAGRIAVGISGNRDPGQARCLMRQHSRPLDGLAFARSSFQWHPAFDRSAVQRALSEGVLSVRRVLCFWALAQEGVARCWEARSRLGRSAPERLSGWRWRTGKSRCIASPVWSADSRSCLHLRGVLLREGIVWRRFRPFVATSRSEGLR